MNKDTCIFVNNVHLDKEREGVAHCDVYDLSRSGIPETSFAINTPMARGLICDIDIEEFSSIIADGEPQLDCCDYWFEVASAKYFATIHGKDVILVEDAFLCTFDNCVVSTFCIQCRVFLKTTASIESPDTVAFVDLVNECYDNHARDYNCHQEMGIATPMTPIKCIYKNDQLLPIQFDLDGVVHCAAMILDSITGHNEWNVTLYSPVTSIPVGTRFVREILRNHGERMQTYSAIVAIVI